MWLYNQFLKKWSILSYYEYFISHIEENIGPGWEKNEITPRSYGMGLLAKFHPHLSPRGEIPSMIEHGLSFRVFL